MCHLRTSLLPDCLGRSQWPGLILLAADLDLEGSHIGMPYDLPSFQSGDFNLLAPWTASRLWGSSWAGSRTTSTDGVNDRP